MRNNFKDLTIIFFLGISSGLPLALLLSTLKALLVDKGFDLATIGFFSLVGIPYSIKFLYAPIIDSFKVPILTKIFGQRRSWIIFTQLLLVIFISLVGVAGLAENLMALAIFSLLLGFASASQDIVIDGYRIELIKKEDQALAAGSYIYGYRVGLLISGAGALILADLVGWDVVYFIMAAIMFSNIITTIIATETRKNWQKKDYNFTQWFKIHVIEPLTDFTNHKKWYLILLFIVFFKLGDAFAGNLTIPFLLDIGFTKSQIAGILKTFGLFATLSGVLIGGLLVKKIGIMKSLWIAGIMQMLSNLAFCYLSQIGSSKEVLYAVVFIENFSGGIGDSVFVAYLSGLCSLNFSATQYALLASLATIGRSIIASTAGVHAQIYGWFEFFLFSTFIAIPGLIFLYWISKSYSMKKAKS